MGKTAAKKCIDILLLLLFFIELGGMFLPSLLHELLGFCLLALVLVHNAINNQFYKNFFRGTNNTHRTANKISILLSQASPFPPTSWQMHISPKI